MKNTNLLRYRISYGGKKFIAQTTVGKFAPLKFFLHSSAPAGMAWDYTSGAIDVGRLLVLAPNVRLLKKLGIWQTGQLILPESVSDNEKKGFFY